MNSEKDEKTISSELERAEKVIGKLEKRYHSLAKANFLSKIQRENLHEDLMTALVFLGDLGNLEDMNEVRTGYEEKARRLFPSNPKKARNTFLKEYEIHTAPFDRLKERCWRIIDRIGTGKKK